MHEFGSITVDEDEVLEFGKRYVPLSYHTDKEAAKQSIYGGAIASGWHTAAHMMRLYTENYLSNVANLGSPAAMSSAGPGLFSRATPCRSAQPLWRRAAPNPAAIAALSAL